MKITAYLYDPDESANRRLRRWLGEHPAEVTFVADTGPSRPQLLHILSEIDGGTLERLAVARLADLGMSARRLAAFLLDCRTRGVAVVSMRESFDLTTEQGRKLAAFLGAVAEGERAAWRSLQRDGIERARAEGRRVGGRPTGTRVRVTDAVERRINALFAAGTPVAEIAGDAAVRVSVRTVYRVIANRDGSRG